MATTRSSTSSSISLNSRVIVLAGNKKGIVRFIGKTHFAEGEWIGVELDEPLGKNSGTIGDTKYFDCQPDYGLFAKKVSEIYFLITSLNIGI